VSSDEDAAVPNQQFIQAILELIRALVLHLREGDYFLPVTTRLRSLPCSSSPSRPFLIRWFDSHR
jgi:hypothetical protein